MKTKKGNLLQNQRQRKRMLALLLAAALTAETAPVNVQAQGNGETVRKPLRGDNRILNVGLSPKQS